MFHAWVTTRYMKTVPSVLIAPRSGLSVPKATTPAATTRPASQRCVARPCRRRAGRKKSANIAAALDRAPNDAAQALAAHHQHRRQRDVENQIDVVEGQERSRRRLDETDRQRRHQRILDPAQTAQ